MSDIVPAPAPLVSRQAAVPTHAPAPAMGAFKPENLQIAEAMARATDLLPKEYANKPGACLLAMDWAERNDVAILDVLANVSFVHGKPVIGARMQKKLAARVGYRTQKVAGDETYCTVAVYDPDGVELGQATYTIEMAQALNLTSRSAVWRADPAQMLFHRATTRALDHYGPGELSVLFSEEAPPEADPVDVVADVEVAGTGEGEGEPAQRQADPPPEPATTGGYDPAAAEADLRAELKRCNVKVTGLMRFATERWPDDGVGTVEALVADEARYAEARDWVLGA